MSETRSPSEFVHDLLGMQAPDEDRQRAGTALLREHARPHRRVLVAGGALSAVVSSTTLALPALIGAAVDAAITGDVGWEVWWVAAVGVVGAVAGMLHGPLLTTAYAATLATIVGGLVEHALALGIPGRRRFEHGDLLNRSAGDATGAVRYVATRVELGAQTLVIAIGAVVGLALLHWSFLVVLVSGVVLILSVGRTVLSRFPQMTKDYRERVGELTGRYVDAERGRRTIQASGTLDRELVRVTQPLGDLSAAAHRLSVAQGTLSAQSEALFSLLTAVIVAAGGILLARDAITPGDILAALSYASFAMGALADLLNRGAFDRAASRVGAARIAEVMLSPPATPRPASDDTVAAPPRPTGAMKLRDVSVGVDPDPVLRAVDLVVAPGVTVAIVGRSGAGKSTIAALAGRLMDPDTGTVHLDGIDVRRLRSLELGSLVSYAFEQPTLLGRTVADTISYGTDASIDEVTAAAAVAAACDFIERLPAGYDTPLDEVPLSGGERQRLGLARAALRPGSLLVLDDATSSLDTATEARVHTSFTELARGRTTLVVAHRASTAARADLVAWLEQGTIRALAPHSELWGDPAYQAVFRATATDVGGAPQDENGEEQPS